MNRTADKFIMLRKDQDFAARLFAEEHARIASDRRARKRRAVVGESASLQRTSRRDFSAAKPLILPA